MSAGPSVDRPSVNNDRCNEPICVGFHALDTTLAHMGKRPKTFQTFIEKSRFDKLMNYFEDEDLGSPLEEMTSNVTVVNDCKKGHNAIGVTLKKCKPRTSLSEKIDDQLGYLSNFILELEDSDSQADLKESLEPEEFEGELFFKACAVQSRVEESDDDTDVLKGHVDGAATLRKSSQPTISSHKKKNKNRKKRGQVRFLTVPNGDNVNGTEDGDEVDEVGKLLEHTTSEEHRQGNIDTKGESAVADEAEAENASTRGTPVKKFLEDDVHRLRGRQHLDYLHGPTRSRRSRSCSPPRSSRSLAGFQSREGYGTNISAALAETEKSCGADCHRLGSERSKEPTTGGLEHDKSKPIKDSRLKFDESMFCRPLADNVCAVCGYAQLMLTDGELRCRKCQPSVFSAMEELSRTVYYTRSPNPRSRVIYMLLDSGSNCHIVKDDFYLWEIKLQNLPIGGVHGTFQSSKKRGKFTA